MFRCPTSRVAERRQMGEYREEGMVEAAGRGEHSVGVGEPGTERQELPRNLIMR